MKIREVKASNIRTLYITGVLATIFLTNPQEAKAVPVSGREVLVGQLPDVFAIAGQDTIRLINFAYTNIGGPSTSAGIFAQPAMAGVIVSDVTGVSVTVNDTDPIEIASARTQSQGIGTWSFKIEVSAAASQGSGTINIYDGPFCDVCPRKYVLIGKVNVYVLSQRYATTFVATKPLDLLGTSPLSFFFVNHPVINGNSGARLLATPNWNPGGTGGVYCNSPIGVRYGYPGRPSPSGMWTIYNENSVPMSVGSSFNVRIGGEASFNQQTNPSNIMGNWTVIDNPITNDNPNAIVFVTHNSGAAMTNHNHNLGVWYIGGRWAIFNQDLSNMPSGLNFTVVAFGYPGDGVFIHTSNTANTSGNQTWINNPLTNNNPNATIFVTPNYNSGATYVYPPIGVYYNQFRQMWAIFLQDRSQMPVGASFNVMIPAAPVY